MNIVLTIVFWVLGIPLFFGILYLIGANMDQNRREDENRVHDALANLYVKDVQMVHHFPTKQEKHDPLQVFGYWVVLPLFCASISLTMILVIALLAGK
ncbi:MAG: hypothetical protein CVU39_07840 [Chloroflexi bacterium HGW-Chloroflexi-10]|nr:MAG: hypothetical protein CVU39_07840 [Chloroflexi bacterium HGW-Chloroflexi-10]